MYHRRAHPEWEILMQQVQDRARFHIRQEEMANMRQTAAQHFIEEGREIGAVEAKRETLVELLPLFRAMRAGFHSDLKALKPALRLNSSPIKWYQS